MDPVTTDANAAANARTTAPTLDRARSATPPESPLAMPTQSLSRFDRKQRHKPTRPRLDMETIAARVFVFGGAIALTAYGVNEMYGVINVGTITTLKWVLLVLFAINFSWIALAFTGAIVGFVSLLRAQRQKSAPKSLREQTAVVMPIYNEAPSRVFAAMLAMIEDVEALGLGQHYTWFLLSDTTNPDIWVAEEQAYLALRERLGDNVRVYYRHRPKNIARKAGNIEEFVKRWGGAYEHMIVLDADSLMTGECIVTLTAAMEEDPDAGIIQTLAAHHQPQHVLRAPAAVLRPSLWHGDRRGPRGVVRAARQLLGP
jgi:membrane glycosyltransferase